MTPISETSTPLHLRCNGFSDIRNLAFYERYVLTFYLAFWRHIFRRSILQCMRRMSLRSIWHYTRHTIFLAFYLTFYLTYVWNVNLSFYPTYIVTFYLAFCGTWLLTFYLAFYVLSDLISDIIQVLSDILCRSMWYSFSMYLTHILTFDLAFHIFPDALFTLVSVTLSSVSYQPSWHSFWRLSDLNAPTPIWSVQRLRVRARPDFDKMSTLPKSRDPHLASERNMITEIPDKAWGCHRHMCLPT